jgi:hypothetical protein
MQYAKGEGSRQQFQCVSTQMEFDCSIRSIVDDYSDGLTEAGNAVGQLA